MFTGLLLTGISLLLLLLWSLWEMHRVDRVIEEVDRKLGPPDSGKDGA